MSQTYKLKSDTYANIAIMYLVSMCNTLAYTQIIYSLTWGMISDKANCSNSKGIDVVARYCQVLLKVNNNTKIRY